MTAAERRRQSAGVSRIAHAIPGAADVHALRRGQYQLERVVGRSLALSFTRPARFDGSHTRVVFEVVDRD